MGFSIYTLLNASEVDNQSDKVGGMVLKMPFSVPYVTDWQITDNGEDELLQGDDHYQIISRNVVNDTLYVHCRYTESSRDRFWELVSDYDEHLKTSDDGTENRGGKVMKNLIKEYMSTDRRLTFLLLNGLPLKFIRTL